MITIVVHGQPSPQGSKTVYGAGRFVESSKAVKPWREAVKYAAIGKVPQPLTGPINLSAVFFFRRPKSHYRTGKYAHILRDDAPLKFKSSIPDLSKLVRSTEDALSDAGIWGDDAQVASLDGTRKVYSNTGFQGAEITISQLPTIRFEDAA